MNKKIAAPLILGSLLIAIPSVQAQYWGPNPALTNLGQRQGAKVSAKRTDKRSTQAKNTTKVLEQSVSTASQEQLYAWTQNKLNRYYGQTSFLDPNHTTGWYRVDDFLNWLKNNETQVKQDYQKIQITDRSNGFQDNALMAFLGVHYIADQYKLKLDYSKLSFAPGQDSRTKACSGHIELRTGHTLLHYINTGIHEGTHILPFLVSGEEYKILPEMATFYSIYVYGLPIKENAGSISEGIRDVAHNEEGFDYHSVVMGPLFMPQLKQIKILSLATAPSVVDGISFMDSLLNYIYAKNNRYLVPGKETYNWNIATTAMELIQKGFITKEQFDNWIDKPKPYPQFIYIGEHDTSKFSMQDGIPQANKNKKTHIVLMRATDPRNGGVLFRVVGDYHPITAEEYLKKLYAPLTVPASVKTFYKDAASMISQEAQNEMFNILLPGIFEVKYKEDDAQILALSRLFQPLIEGRMPYLIQQAGIKPIPIPQGYQ